MSEKTGIGLTARYFHSNLGAGNSNGATYKAATAVAADISIFYNGLSREGQGWARGVVVSNLGSRISYSNDATTKDFLPAAAGVGIAYTRIASEDNRWTLSSEAQKLLVPSVPSDSAGQASYHTMGLVNSWGKSFSNAAYTFRARGEYSYKEEFFLRDGRKTNIGKRMMGRKSKKPKQ